MDGKCGAMSLRLADEHIFRMNKELAIYLVSQFAR
jgi:hypothetical protein